MYAVWTVHHRDKGNKYLYNQSRKPFGGNRGPRVHLHIEPNIDITPSDRDHSLLNSGHFIHKIHAVRSNHGLYVMFHWHCTGCFCYKENLLLCERGNKWWQLCPWSSGFWCKWTSSKISDWFFFSFQVKSRTTVWAESRPRALTQSWRSLHLGESHLYSTDPHSDPHFHIVMMCKLLLEVPCPPSDPGNLLCKNRLSVC